MFTVVGCDRRLAPSSNPAQDVAVKENPASTSQVEKQEADVTEVNRLNRAIIRAAARGDVKRVKRWILEGASVNAKGKDGRTPLHFAVQEGHNELSEVLITKGPNVNAQDNFGLTPLHVAAVKGHKRIVEFLLAAGANVNARDNAGRTPLHYAAGAGHNYGTGVINDDIIQLLLNKGASINATDKGGWTPLHYATRHRHISAVEILINRGADLSITDERGRTVLSLIREMQSLYRAHIYENERLKSYMEIADFLRQCKSAYFVAPDGNDSYPGTLERPFRTIIAGVSSAEAGDTIFVRGGVYNCTSTINIHKSGGQGKPICLRAYPGEAPLLDFSVAQGDGFSIRGAYWHFKGLTVTGTAAWGLRVEYKEAHHNILEQITAYANRLAGVAILNGAAYNLVLNCDSYRNFHPETNGENADGFNASRYVGKGNVFIGCRAWNNSDDGFDNTMTFEGVRLEDCYACRNGENIWDYPCFTGNAEGFKIGGEGAHHVLVGCVAWDHDLRGFLGNLDQAGYTILNCTAFRNNIGFGLYRSGDIIENTSILRNNLSVGGRIVIDFEADAQHNSWNLSVSSDIAKDDFLCLDDSVILGPRFPDGSVPESDFPRLAPGSDVIDAGVDVGLPFVGKAPDLGAFEYNPAAAGKRNPKMLHQAVRDYDIEKIRKMISEGADVNEKDWLGYVPLHWAIYFGYPDAANLLISQGANPNLLSDTGRTPLEIAKAMEYNGLVELLRKHGAEQ
jgi:ankyrin repeat protein